MLTGATVVLKALEDEGVEVVFGIPGGAIMPLYDALIDSSIRHILMRHEQGAGHAAEGYAHVTGRPGVCFATSGPGACNLVTALSDAMMDSISLVAITGQVSRSSLGKQAFQEAPVTDITRPVTKWNWLVRDPDDLADVVREALRLATSGRPGPVLIDIPKDVQLAEAHYSRSPRPAPMNLLPEASALRKAANELLRAQRPVLYVGGGAVKAQAWAEVKILAETQRLPVVATLMARGVFPDSHPFCLGMPGMHGSYAAVTAMQKADLLVCVGARFDDRVTGRIDGFAPGARIIHVDVDEREIGKIRRADVALVGDARLVVGALNRHLEESGHQPATDRGSWMRMVQEWKATYPFVYEQTANGPLKPQYVIERLHKLTSGNAILTAGVGQHQMWTSQLWHFERPREWANSGGAGTMGFAIPAALGAKAARPGELVIAIDGDGSFQMTGQELATSVSESLPIIVAVINNGQLGMVRQWQELFHSRRYSQVHLGFECPDFVRLAEAYGCVGLRARTPCEVDAVIERALVLTDRTVVIDFQVDPTEICYPMVPSGCSNDEIVLGPAIGRNSAAQTA